MPRRPAGTRQWPAVLLLSVSLAVGCAAPASVPQPSVEPPAPSVSRVPESPPGLPDLAPELEGAISADESGVLDNIQLVLVSVDGRLVSELYRHEATPSTYTHVWSVTKSVVSTLVGIAIAEGKIKSLDQTVAQLLPGRRPEMSKGVARVTLRELLSMSSGLSDQVYFQESSAEDDSLATILALPLEAQGTFSYANVGSHLVAAIVAERTNMPLLTYARSRLFAPLGISTAPAYTGSEPALRPSQEFLAPGFAWATTSDGFHHGCCMLKLTGPDMIKLGQLCAQNGRWQGRQLLPVDWVREATEPSEANSDYGLLWWRPEVNGRTAYAAIGAFGQMILVIPELSAVVAVSSRVAVGTPVTEAELLDLVERVIVPAIE